MAKLIKKQSIDLLNFRPLIPMGAIKPSVDELLEAIENPDYIAEVKYDGYRMPGWLDKEIRFTTRSIAIETARNGDPWPTERTANLPHLTCLKHRISGTIPDGEIWKPGCRSHDITSMIGGLADTSLANQIEKGFTHYMMYDLIQYKGKEIKDVIYSERRKYLEEIYHDLLYLNRDWYFEHPKTGEILCKDIKDYLHISEIVPFEGRKEKYIEIVENGGEGLILKHKDSLYHEGKISNGKGVPAKVKANKKKGIPFTPWIKWKKNDTFDCIITGFEPATIDYSGNDRGTCQYWMETNTGKKVEVDWDDSNDMSMMNDPEANFIPITKFHFYGWIGSIKFGQYDKAGNLIEVGYTSGITDEVRKDFSENPEKYIGRVCIVEAMERIKKTQALREPRFKGLRMEGDKNPNECIIED
jgi:ATP-dependent DNA ligase